VEPKKPVQPKRVFWTPALRIALLLFVVFALLILGGRRNLFSSPQEITWQEFERSMLRRKAVDKIMVVNKETAFVYIKEEFNNDSAFSRILKPPVGGGINPGPHYSFNIGSVESLERKLDEAQSDTPSADRIGVQYEDKSSANDILLWVIPVLIFIFMFRLFLRTQGGGGTGGAGRESRPGGRRGWRE